MTSIRIKGMNCASCVAMVRMALEDDPALASRLQEVRLVSGADHSGEAVFDELTADQIRQAAAVIDQAGHYQAVRN